mmetsp:Transcript_6694/g.22279  ORF Transcript_6694/g.22279 Transcript_6694/m.22279 type:complete len:208 (-) Transcript_6694:1007-1630(-)
MGVGEEGAEIAEREPFCGSVVVVDGRSVGLGVGADNAGGGLELARSGGPGGAERGGDVRLPERAVRVGVERREGARRERGPEPPRLACLALHPTPVRERRHKLLAPDPAVPVNVERCVQLRRLARAQRQPQRPRVPQHVLRAHRVVRVLVQRQPQRLQPLRLLATPAPSRQVRVARVLHPRQQLPSQREQQRLVQPVVGHKLPNPER